MINQFGIHQNTFVEIAHPIISDYTSNYLIYLVMVKNMLPFIGNYLVVLIHGMLLTYWRRQFDHFGIRWWW